MPKFGKLKKAQSAKVMKGRPFTGEEFDRILAEVDALPERQRDSLKFLLRGLWYSGLRLGEALSLTWDQWADRIRVDTSGKYTVLLIPSDGEKGGKDRTYPITRTLKSSYSGFHLKTVKDTYSVRSSTGASVDDWIPYPGQSPNWARRRPSRWTR